MNLNSMKVLFMGVLLSAAMVGTAQKKKTKTKTVNEKELAASTPENLSKEIELSKEVDAPAGATIRIVCSNQNLDIRRSNSNKVRLTTKVEVDKSNTLSNDELFEKFGLTMHSLNNRVDISAKGSGNGFIFTGPGNKTMNFEYHSNEPSRVHVDRIRAIDEERIKRQAEEAYQRAMKQTAKVQKEMMVIGEEQKRNLKEMIGDEVSQEKLHALNELEREGALSKDEQKELARLRSKGPRVFVDGKDFDMFSQNGNMRKFTPPAPPSIPRMPKITMPPMPDLTKMEGMFNNMNFNFSFNERIKSSLVVYVPVDAKLDIENKYGNVILADDYKEASFNLSNGSLDARKIGDLKLISKYTNVNIGDVDDAQVEFENGTFTAGNIKDLDIDSKFSTIEVDNSNNILIRSQNDNYTVESVEKLEGRKSYGTFHINKLGKSFILDGQNADLRIKNMSAGVDKVKLNDRYADIRLPVKDLQNYSVTFDGEYSSVYGPFEKHNTESASSSQKHESETYRVSGDNSLFLINGDRKRRNTGETTPNFTATMGNTSGAHTVFDIKCNQCTVDFK